MSKNQDKQKSNSFNNSVDTAKVSSDSSSRDKDKNSSKKK
jgi:hypothetical protein